MNKSPDVNGFELANDWRFFRTPIPTPRCRFGRSLYSGEAVRTEAGEQGMLLAIGNFTGQKFAGNETERCPAVAKSHVVALDTLQLAEYRFTVARIGFGPTP
jgi:hypothetical protein